MSTFPEGVTHDQLTVLPFKKGICITAFNMLEKKGIKINLVPAGIIYYNHHLPRSQVYIKFGKPVTISDKLYEIYQTNKN